MSIEDCLHGDTIRHFAVVDLGKLREFRAEHDAHIAKKSRDPAGQDYSFKYIPPGDATFVHIGCRCGAEKDITDYDSI